MRLAVCERVSVDVRVRVVLAVRDSVLDGDAAPDAEMDWDGLTLDDAVADPLPVELIVEEAVFDTLGVPDDDADKGCDVDWLSEGVADAVLLGVRVRPELGVPEPLAEPLGDALDDAVALRVPLAAPVRVCVPLRVPLVVRLADCVRVCDPEGVRDRDRVPDGERVWVAEAEALGFRLRVAPGVRAADGDDDGLPDSDPLADPLPLGDGLPLVDNVACAVPDALGLRVPSGDRVDVWLRVARPLGVEVSDGERVCVELAVVV